MVACPLQPFINLSIYPPIWLAGVRIALYDGKGGERGRKKGGEKGGFPCCMALGYV